VDLSEDLLKKPPSPSPSPWLSSPSPSPAKVDLSPKSGLKYYKSVPDCMSQVTKRSTKFGQDTWTFEKKLTGQTHSVAGQGDRSAMYLAGNDLLVSLDLLVSVERRKTSSHLIDEDAERPPVYRIIVTLEWQTDRHTNGVKKCLCAQHVHRPSVLWHCWFGHVTRKTVSEMTYNVSSGTLNSTIPYPARTVVTSATCTGRWMLFIVTFHCLT